MDTDDLETRKQKPKPKDLESLSIEALNDYVAELQAEIERARLMIAGKQSARTAADTVFKI
jgi:uncharacterized small protein (DUF1192 family)